MNTEQVMMQKKKTISVPENRLLINKAFFGKNNCLKVTLNSNRECYFHFGQVDKTNSWVWKKIKFNPLGMDIT